MKGSDLCVYVRSVAMDRMIGGKSYPLQPQNFHYFLCFCKGSVEERRTEEPLTNSLYLFLNPFLFTEVAFQLEEK